MRILKGAIRSAGQQMSDEAKSVRVVERPEKATIKAFVDSPGPFALASPSFLVVSGAQGTGKTTMLKSLFAEYHDDGRWVLPVSQEIDPGGKLDLTDVVQQALRTRNLPQFLPSFQLIPTLLRTLSEKCSRESGGPLIVYLQLSTKIRGAPFTDDQCDALATEIGAFGRKLTYDYPLCKLIVELSVSLIADKIQDKFNMSRLVVVDPLPWKRFVELALEKPEIAPYLKMDELSRQEILKYFYLRAGGSFRELQRLLEDAAQANASDAQGIRGEIDKWYEKKIQPIKDALAETEEEEEEEEEGWLEKFFRELRGEKKPKKEPKSKYLDYVRKVAEAGPKGYLSRGDALKKETKLQMELRRLQPAQAVLRSTTSTQVALRHWYFVFYVLGETEKALQDAGYM